MDIFVIEAGISENIEKSLLEQFGNKKFSNPKKRYVHSLSYLMLDSILKEVYKIEDRNIVFLNKKPYLANRQKYFSISHSGDYITLVFSDYDCGADIEKIKHRDFAAIAERMGFDSKTEEGFYYDWTLYEAEYKLGGKSAKYKSFKYSDYIITASSSNKEEVFELYIQNGNNFSNLGVLIF